MTINKFVLCLTLICIFGCKLIAGERAHEECSKNLLLSYFPEPVVNEVLSEYNIRQDLWPQINADLAKQDEIIVNIVEQKAAKMKGNPLYDIQKKDVAVAIYRETLYEVIAETMKKYGIDRQPRIEAMLDEIQYKKGKLFNECMNRQRKALDMPSKESQ